MIKTRGKLFLISLIAIVGGFYILLLLFYPEISLRLGNRKYDPPRIESAGPVSLPVGPGGAVDPDENTDTQGQLYDTENTLVIEKIGIVLKIIESDSASALDRGSWHRYPERGDPLLGGNFILTGHRFGFDWTPAGIARNSAFYHLDKLEAGDIVTVYWEQQKYDYEVTDVSSTDPNAAWIEAQSSEPRLTLYTCTLKGEHDGRVVVVAKPLQ